MDHPQRFIYLVLAIAWSIFRLLRYLRMSGSKRPAPAVPPSSGAPPGPVTARSPIEPAGATGSGLGGSALAAAVFIPATVVIWSLLFMLPALGDVPPMLRMVAGVLATLYFLQLARSVANRFGSERAAVDDNNPIK